jgi:hypothetical protein
VELTVASDLATVKNRLLNAVAQNLPDPFWERAYASSGFEGVIGVTRESFTVTARIDLPGLAVSSVGDDVFKKAVAADLGVSASAISIVSKIVTAAKRKRFSRRSLLQTGVTVIYDLVNIAGGGGGG